MMFIEKKEIMRIEYNKLRKKNQFEKEVTVSLKAP